MQKVLVTGANGFIGSHLVEELVAQGYFVRALVEYNSLNSAGWLDILNDEVKTKIKVIAGDIRDYDIVASSIKGCHSVLHLAALVAIPYSYIAPASYIQTNVMGTLNVLNACRRYDVKHLICTSTSETYGSAKFVPISEKHPLSAQSPYAASKIAADQLALSFFHSYELPVSILRPFNTYGPRQSVRAVIPSAISQIASGKSEIRLGSLFPTRDFTFVKDTAEGFILAMNCKSVIGKVTNIGSNFEISIADTIKLIAGLMDSSVNILQDKEKMRPKSSEVVRLLADTTKAHNRFNWQPQYGGEEGFVRGLEETIRWFTNPRNLSLYQKNNLNL